MQQYTQEELNSAVDFGVKLLSGEIDGASVPVSGDLFALRGLLIGLAQGQLSIGPKPAQPQINPMGKRGVDFDYKKRGDGKVIMTPPNPPGEKQNPKSIPTKAEIIAAGFKP